MAPSDQTSLGTGLTDFAIGYEYAKGDHQIKRQVNSHLFPHHYRKIRKNCFPPKREAV